MFTFQPKMVNDQLNQLYLDLELEGLSKNLALDEGITSSSSSDENSGKSPQVRITLYYYQRIII